MCDRIRVHLTGSSSRTGWGRVSFAHFTDQETEAQGHEGSSPQTTRGARVLCVLKPISRFWRDRAVCYTALETPRLSLVSSYTPLGAGGFCRENLLRVGGIPPPSEVGLFSEP